jgi:hypothetical protein
MASTSPGRRPSSRARPPVSASRPLGPSPHTALGSCLLCATSPRGSGPSPPQAWTRPPTISGRSTWPTWRRCGRSPTVGQRPARRHRGRCLQRTEHLGRAGAGVRRTGFQCGVLRSPRARRQRRHPAVCRGARDRGPHRRDRGGGFGRSCVRERGVVGCSAPAARAGGRDSGGEGVGAGAAVPHRGCAAEPENYIGTLNGFIEADDRAGLVEYFHTQVVGLPMECSSR